MPLEIIGQSPGQGIIQTVAGNGSSIYSGDGGSALNAGLSPNAMVTDSKGDIYFSDGSNNRVRRVDASTGIITTVAGNGNGLYYSPAGPSATDYALASPGLLALDNVGDLMILAGPQGYASGCGLYKVVLATGAISETAYANCNISAITYDQHGNGFFANIDEESYTYTTQGSNNVTVYDYKGGIDEILAADGSTKVLLPSFHYYGDCSATVSGGPPYNTPCHSIISSMAVDSSGFIYYVLYTIQTHNLKLSIS